jgi:squalene-hopene/tetraprenyl-beta-curcumene cyclase
MSATALSESTDRSLRDMFERQSEGGAFISHGEVEIPHITTDFELSLQAVRAVTCPRQAGCNPLTSPS